MNATQIFSLVLTATCASLSAVPAHAVNTGKAGFEVRAAKRLEPVQKIGNGIKLFSGVPSRDRIDEISRVVVANDPSFFRVAAESLALRDVRTFIDDMTYVTYAQMHDGVEVFDSHVILVYKSGKLVLSEVATLDALTLSTTPAITASAADRLAMDSLAGSAGLGIEEASAPVVFEQESGAPRLGFRSIVRTEAPIGRWLTVVAADGTNEILFRRNLVAFDAAQLLIEVEPRTVGDAPIAVPAPGHRISATEKTDGDGIFESAAGNVTIGVAGPNFTVNNQAANERTKQLSIQGGSFETFTWAASEGAIEELDAFYHSNVVREHQLQITPDLGWLNVNLPVNVNVGGTCNAFYDGGSINFFPAGGGCNSTARISDVVYHEYGHGLHDNLVGAGQMNSQIQEGVADYFASTITDDPNLGPYFFPDNIAGIRNATEVRTYPSGVQGQYGGDAVHEQGKIWTNTWWNLRTTMMAKHGRNLGLRFVDALHSNTLRGNPGYTTMYNMALAADDDDGDISNGTPNSCEITAEFQAHGLVGTAQPTRGFLALTHVPPASTTSVTSFQAADAPVAVSLDIASKSPTCGGLDAASVTLHYKVNGAAAQTVALSGTTTFAGEIPGQKEGDVVEYWFSAKEDALGAEFTAPLLAPANVYRYYVGPLTTVFRDDFEGADAWTHGGDVASHDDWERGAPKGLGLDPGAAFSGSTAWGNDIGLRGGNGLYEAGMKNWLESPAIDCSECEGTRLQFRRWISLEGSDKARVLVNGTAVWESEPTGRADLMWSFQDIDISAIADAAAEVKVRFELEANGTLSFGGWGVDDVAIMAVTGGEAPVDPANPGMGDTLNGGCTCSVAAATGTVPSGTTLLASMLSILAAGAMLRRRG